MDCPKCHNNISEKATVCPHCHKVLALTCPNCHSISHSAICEKCGYIILEKCSKCNSLVPTANVHCKCGFSTATSVAYNECETDEFAVITLNFGILQELKKILGSKELYTKFLVKLKNLITAQIKDQALCVITYGNTYNINFNKELSFATSVNKALKLALKIITAFVSLNQNLIEQFGLSLKLEVSIQKKSAEELLLNKSVTSKIKLLLTEKEKVSYLKGLNLTMDQFCHDTVKDYQTDSLYSTDINGINVMFYKVLLDKYILPPSKQDEQVVERASSLIKNVTKEPNHQEDLYGFNIFDINAKCSFQKYSAENIYSGLDTKSRIVALKGELCYMPKVSELAKHYESQGYTTIYVSYTHDLLYKPWGLLEKIYKAYFDLSITKGLINKNFNSKAFSQIRKIIFEENNTSLMPEEARAIVIEQFAALLESLTNCVIIIDNFDNIDDSSIQALELYFNNRIKFSNIFLFMTEKQPVHSKIKCLLQQYAYKEITLLPTHMESILTNIKSDATDFINSFFYEKIKENFCGSKLYFEHALRLLTDKNILITFDDKLLIKNNASMVIPKDIKSLVRARLKLLANNQDASMILAYSVFLGERLDMATLQALGIQNLLDNIKLLENTGFIFIRKQSVYINNFQLLASCIEYSLKKEVLEFLAKNIIAKLGKLLDNTSLIVLMGCLSMHKEVYMLLWKNAQYSLECGDYDAYLQNCMEYLNAIDIVNDKLTQDIIDKNKKEIYENILSRLYAYQPTKIYGMENILLKDAFAENDRDKIVKLSNMMLQGALISANYADAYSLLHNILERTDNPSLLVNGSVNTRFFLLSLINLEILYSIGKYRNCIELAEEMLNLLQPDIIEKIKPKNFSLNSFITHIYESFRLVVFAKLIANDADISTFIDNTEKALGNEFEDKECIYAISDFLSGAKYVPSNIEQATPFSKTIFLILHELSNLTTDYKSFAQNIYQAKLLAADIGEKQLEYFCELLIAYAYHKAGADLKSNAIISDIINQSEHSNIFGVNIISKYFKVQNLFDNTDNDEALKIINDVLGSLQKNQNEAEVFFAMYQRAFIDVVKQQNNASVNLEVELHKLIQISETGKLNKIIRNAEVLKDLDLIASDIAQA